MAISDITGKDDLFILVNTFYKKVNSEALLAPFFAHVNWDKHLPLMVDFWDNVLFYNGNYSGNPMALHQAAHQINPMESRHFDKWLELFQATTDQLFIGKNASTLKERAASIAVIMQIKILGLNPVSGNK